MERVPAYRRYLVRTAYSPRWKFLHPVINRLVMNAGPEGQWMRVVMHQALDRSVAALEPHRRSVLEISGNRWENRVPFKAYRSVDYPEFDVCQTVLPERYDLIFAEQVFEHLLWPYRAGRNVYEMLAPGGVFVVSTPFLVRLHYHPYDCSRWTETGLKHFLAECGFDESRIVTRSWGNRACVRGNLSRWLTYMRGWHSLENEPDYPVMVWALATK